MKYLNESVSSVLCAKAIFDTTKKIVRFEDKNHWSRDTLEHL